MTSVSLYRKVLTHLLKGEINWEKDPIKVMLLSAAHVPSDDEFYSEIKSNEVVGKGYTEGGYTLLNKKLILRGKEVAGTADDALWTFSTLSVRYAALYNALNKVLIGCVDFGSIQTTNNGTFQITWSESGLFTLSN